MLATMARPARLALLLVVACTPSGDPRKAEPTIEAAAPPPPDEPKEGPGELAPRDPRVVETRPVRGPSVDPLAGITAPPAPLEPGPSWWCACYSRSTATGGEPLTACRKEQAECRTLERSVAAGKRGIVQGSLTHPCQELTAAHPGDLYGGLDAWQPSKKPGAWLSLGRCHLPGTPLYVEPAGDDGDDGADAQGPDVYALESIGGIKLNTPAAAVLELLGEPRTRDRIEMEEASGSYVQTWNYPDQGVHVTMSSDTRKGAQSVHFVRIVPPAKLLSARGLGLGAAYEKVVETYKDLRAPDDDGSDPEFVTAGDLYGGLIFRFEGGEAVEVMLGAVAE